MKILKQKLSSRKLWAAVAGIITGLTMVFGLDESVVGTVAGAVTAVASVISYIVAEGKIDTARIAAASKAVSAASEAVTASEGATAVPENAAAPENT